VQAPHGVYLFASGCLVPLRCGGPKNKEETMSYTIVADVCEGVADCIPVCPVECIHWAEGKTNAKGTKYTWIDDSVCIDCGACLSVCPIEGAILDEWKPELQKP